MHQGMISVAPQCTLADAAAEMARNRVHCVIIDGIAQDASAEERLVWAILSDVDLMRAVAAGRLDVLARDIALSELVTIDPSDTVEHAAQLMGEHEVTHIVVVEPGNGQPSGVVSSLGIAGVLARN
jgi:CBS domain-containing protein